MSEPVARRVQARLAGRWPGEGGGDEPSAVRTWKLARGRPVRHNPLMLTIADKVAAGLRLSEAETLVMLLRDPERDTRKDGQRIHEAFEGMVLDAMALSEQRRS